MTQATHERLSATETVVAGQDGSFGVVMAAAFSIMALINGWYGGWLWLWIAGVAALLAALLRPVLLHPLNRAWLALGLLLHRVVNPIVRLPRWTSPSPPIMLPAGASRVMSGPADERRRNSSQAHDDLDCWRGH